MKRILAFSILLVFLFSVAAMATETRVMTMGEVNEVVKDDANIWLYPSTIAMYPNIFIGEFYGNDFSRAGGHWALGANTFGAYFSNDDDYYNWAVGESIDHRMDLFWGMNFSDVPMGLRISFWKDGYSYERTPQTTGSLDYDYSYRRFEVALGATLMQGALDAAFTFGTTTWTEENTGYDGPVDDRSFYTYDSTEPDGNTDFDLRFRYWYEYNNQWTLVPHASFTSMSQGAIYNSSYWDTDGDWGFYNSYNYQYDGSYFQLGLGTNYQVSENVMTVTDIGFDFISETDDNEWISDPDADPSWNYQENYDYSDNILPYFKIGLDANVLKWLDLRCGAYTSWYSYENKYDVVYDPDDDDDSYNSVYKSNGAYTDLYLGAGLTWGDVEFDVEVNTDFVENGPYFISGSGDNLFERVTMKYNF